MESLLGFLRLEESDCTTFGDVNVNAQIEETEKNLCQSFGILRYKKQKSAPTRVTYTSVPCVDHTISTDLIKTKTLKIIMSDNCAPEVALLLLNSMNVFNSNFTKEFLRNLKRV